MLALNSQNHVSGNYILFHSAICSKNKHIAKISTKTFCIELWKHIEFKFFISKLENIVFFSLPNAISVINRI